ncbi:MAG: hypothetical protein OXC82_06020 [Rhodobacteraceae bacterium]|nr:hypothetical protein [Paracoccaceae bacterium]MCY4249976.1 hypothetical protein [Paracoccaceae bacterium]
MRLLVIDMGHVFRIGLKRKGGAIDASDRHIGSINAICFGHRINKLLAFGFVSPDIQLNPGLGQNY